jgi:hypothetical protein
MNPTFNHKWVYGKMHNWRLRGCKKNDNQTKSKSTTCLEGSTPNGGAITFEYHVGIAYNHHFGVYGQDRK